MLNPEIPGGDRPIDALARSHFLDGLADALHPSIRRARDASPAFKSAISGTWLGHALHPAVTDVPIGAFTALAVLDAAEILTDANVGASSDIVLGVGILGALASAATGWFDWSDTAEGPRTIGMWHAVLNGASIVLYEASFVARRKKARRRGISFAFAGYAFLSLAAYLGGELSLGMLLGSRHTAGMLKGLSDFVEVADEAALRTGTPLRVEASGVPILLVRMGDTIVALAAACTHRGAPLEEGTLEHEDTCLRCPWHGALFDIGSGRVLEGPATFPLPTYEVRSSGGRISVRARRFATP